MKKVVAGFVAGVLFAIGATSFADGVSLVGKKIQSEVAVTAKGEQLPDKAIVVDGKSYAPVRAVAEAAGMQVSYGKGGIVLTETAQEPTVNQVTNPVDESKKEKETTSNNLKKERLLRDIEEATERKEQFQKAIDQINESLTRSSSQMKTEDAQRLIEDNQIMIEKIDKEIENSKKMLTELDEQSK
ncbi:hypothetical protein P4H94_23080 [Paenibacillus macerans]|uniref:hypothetical protein n=1 Tax=Paenibacillus macerans TaxID=44252 RepID=UPI002DBB6DB4|nr:hypothetical protein [Paenibacillus macerans]MEC0139740.1 hypothetical protein [Paenibacillus macerans]